MADGEVYVFDNEWVMFLFVTCVLSGFYVQWLGQYVCW